MFAGLTYHIQEEIGYFRPWLFWHRCQKCNLPMPKTNQEYWEDKFTRNQIRDSRKRSEIERLGWKVLVLGNVS